MKFYSTNKDSPLASFKEALLQGLASDKGLFMPQRLPILDKKFYKNLKGMSFKEIALNVSLAILGDDFSASELENIIGAAFTFDSPLVQLSEGLFVLELFHGPTLAFKDFGARYMAELMEFYMQDSKKPLYILAATSGDTGSAVAQAFYNKANIKVVILYPSGKVSEIQEKQLTTVGGNVTTLEVDGNFDDCQKMVKDAFLDSDITAQLLLTSANSINIARLIPQSFYYFSACAQVKNFEDEIIFSVPSGNFGNLTAGVMAKRIGLPVEQFIAATNENDIVPQYLKTGEFSPRPSVQTISNAMDVGNPSNFARLSNLFFDDFSKMNESISGAKFSDDATRTGIKELHEKYNYLADPHSAVAYMGIKDTASSAQKIFLSTAHPAKFLDVVKEVTSVEVEIPERLKNCLSKEKQSTFLKNKYEDFKQLLLSL